MKKSTFIDYTVILAALSNRKKRRIEKRKQLLLRALENVSSMPNQHPVAA